MFMQNKFKAVQLIQYRLEVDFLLNIVVVKLQNKLLTRLFCMLGNARCFPLS